MDSRRLLLAFGLSLIVLLLYERLILSRYPQPAPDTPSESVVAEPPSLPAKESTQPVAVAAAVPPGDEPVTVETPLFRARITRVGARLASFELERYRESVGPGSPPLQLVRPGPALPLHVELPGIGDDAAVAYKPDHTTLTLPPGERGTVVFTGEGPGGTRLEKRFTFEADSYLFEVDVTASAERAPRRIGLVLVPMPAEQHQGGGHEAAIELAGGKLHAVPLEDIVEAEASTASAEAPARWAGFAAQYFLAVAVPSSSAAVHMSAAQYLVEDTAQCSDENLACAAGPKRGWRCRGSDAACNGASSAATCTACLSQLPLVRVEAPADAGHAAFQVYLGPKDRQALARAGNDLDRAVDLGWFWFIALPLLKGLELLYQVTGNYGVAIIVLTTLVKVVTIPLTHVTYKNMKEMQKIQPQMQRIRERFKDDAQAMQREMLELYRRHRVNPLSGCLPMLLQLPIFVGLYNALMYSIELRHAPFALWINDLSAPDRLHLLGIGIPVLTLIMGASMFVQQWLQPPQGDPTQQRVMMIMPVIFTFMFINFPAGLVLYWLVNNIMTIGQQYWMMRST